MSNKSDLQEELKKLENKRDDLKQNDHSGRVALEFKIAELERKIEKEG